MGLFYVFSVILIFWTILYLVNTLLIECSITSARYAKFLSKKGLSINLFQIKWYTARCNRLFIKMSSWEPKFLMWWFNAGVLFGLLGQVGSIFLLIYTLIDFFRSKPMSEQVLVPVVPGVNLPGDQTGYYVFALFVCGIVHEFGHAIAASRFLLLLL
jgi:S2P endopeptidase